MICFDFEGENETLIGGIKDGARFEKFCNLKRATSLVFIVYTVCRDPAGNRSCGPF
jgi:hypothetical protein